MMNGNFGFRTPDPGLKDRKIRNPHPAIRSSLGFTYVALLAAIVIIGIALGSAGKYWQNVMLREKEEELLFRGNQYRSAIERYYYSKAPNAYPQSIEDLLTDNRTATGRRHLRQKFKDPMTGEDFELIRDMTKGNRITGVYSKSETEPLRQTGFSEENKDFEGKKQYKDWKFLFDPQQAQQLTPAPPAQPAKPAA